MQPAHHVFILGMLILAHVAPYHAIRSKTAIAYDTKSPSNGESVDLNELMNDNDPELEEPSASVNDNTKGRRGFANEDDDDDDDDDGEEEGEEDADDSGLTDTQVNTIQEKWKAESDDEGEILDMTQVKKEASDKFSGQPLKDVLAACEALEQIGVANQKMTPKKLGWAVNPVCRKQCKDDLAAKNCHDGCCTGVCSFFAFTGTHVFCITRCLKNIPGMS